MGVIFLARDSRLGSKTVIGPVTGLTYTIDARGTPVSDLDAEALLSLTEPPCCGDAFDRVIKSFYRHNPTRRQLDSVPERVLNAKPAVIKMSQAKRISGGRRKKSVKEG